MNLTDSEIERYSRHLILDGVGVQGQEKIKKTRVLVIGAGGLGSPVLLYLAAAGFGHITIADHDVLDLSNLQRQVLFNQSHLKKNKAVSAVQVLQQLNSDIMLEAIPEGITTDNAIPLFENHDIIVDGTDNFSTRYLICDAGIITNKPIIYGAIHKFEGQVSVLNYQDGPTYRCLFPIPPHEEKVHNCNEVGVLGVLPGMIGTLMINEVLKMVLDLGNVLSGRLFTINLKTLDNSSLAFKRNQNMIDNLGLNQAKFKSEDYKLMCEFSTAIVIEQILGEAFKTLIDNKNYTLLDVREEWEKPIIAANNLLNIPLKLIDYFIPEETKRTFVTICQSGNRSQKAALKLKAKFPDLKIKNLKGGIIST